MTGNSDLIETIKSDLDEKILGLNNKELMEGLIPFTKLNNMNICVDKLHKHIKNGSKIRVIGDYDADGILATTIMVSFFRKHPELPSNIDYFIPDRLKHGYGVSPLLVDMAKEDGIDLIITVDNGVSAVPAIDRANELGIDVIITDHHTVPEVLPKIDTILNPLLDDMEWNSISGATVAWAFCYAINESLDEQINTMEFIDLAALTILSDVIALNDVNKAILEFGFEKIREGSREIYRKLFTEENMKNLKSADISFGLIPKINAMGRLSDANIGVRLFMEKDIDDLLSIVENTNEDRKDISHDQLLLVLDQAAEQDKKHNIIIVKHDGLHEGVVGILASRIVERFKKPAMVLTSHGDQIKGSARSIGKISVYELLFDQQHLLTKWGGHAGAAGLGLFEKDLEALRDGMDQYLIKNHTQEDYSDNKYFYNIGNLKMLDLKLSNSLDMYEPYGQGFDKPVFKIKVKVIEILKHSKGKHYWCVVRDRLHTKKKIWFYHFSENMEDYLNIQKDVYINVNTNFWQDRKSASLSCTFVD